MGKKIDKNFKEDIYEKLHNEENIDELIHTFLSFIDKKRKDKIYESIAVIKQIIKDKLPPIEKFYALSILKKMMETKNDLVIKYFNEKIIIRLSEIALYKYKTKEKPFIKGETCLDIYYPPNKIPKSARQQNKLDSSQFFILLLECWKHWYQMFPKNKKIQKHAKKLKPYFLKNDIDKYYNYYKNYHDTQNKNEDNSEDENFKNDNEKDKDNNFVQNEDNFKDVNINESKILKNLEDFEKTVNFFNDITLENEVEKDIIFDFEPNFRGFKDQFEITKHSVINKPNTDLKRDFNSNYNKLNSILKNYEDFSKKKINDKQLIKNLKKITSKKKEEKNNHKEKNDFKTKDTEFDTNNELNEFKTNKKIDPFDTNKVVKTLNKNDEFDNFNNDFDKENSFDEKEVKKRNMNMEKNHFKKNFAEEDINESINNFEGVHEIKNIKEIDSEEEKFIDFDQMIDVKEKEDNLEEFKFDNNKKRKKEKFELTNFNFDNEIHNRKNVTKVKKKGRKNSFEPPYKKKGETKNSKKNSFEFDFNDEKVKNNIINKITSKNKFISELSVIDEVEGDSRYSHSKITKKKSENNFNSPFSNFDSNKLNFAKNFELHKSEDPRIRSIDDNIKKKNLSNDLKKEKTGISLDFSKKKKNKKYKNFEKKSNYNDSIKKEDEDDLEFEFDKSEISNKSNIKDNKSLISNKSEAKEFNFKGTFKLEDRLDKMDLDKLKKSNTPKKEYKIEDNYTKNMSNSIKSKSINSKRKSTSNSNSKLKKKKILKQITIDSNESKNINNTISKSRSTLENSNLFNSMDSKYKNRRKKLENVKKSFHDVESTNKTHGKINLDVDAFDSDKYLDPDFNSVQKSVISNNFLNNVGSPKRFIFSPKAIKKIDMSIRSDVLMNSLDTRNRLKEKSANNFKNGNTSLMNENIKSQNFSNLAILENNFMDHYGKSKQVFDEENESESLKKQNEYIRNYCNHLHLEIKNLREKLDDNKLENSIDTNILNNEFDLEDDEKTDFNILKRKNEYLIRHNEILEKVNQDLISKNKLKIEKLKQKKDLLKNLGDEFQNYIKALNKEVELEKNHNNKNDFKINSLQKQIKAYTKKLLNFKTDYNNAKNEIIKKTQIIQDHLNSNSKNIEKKQSFFQKENIKIKQNLIPDENIEIKNTLPNNNKIFPNFLNKQVIKYLEVKKKKEAKKELSYSKIIRREFEKKKQLNSIKKKTNMTHSLNLYGAFFKNLQNKKKQNISLNIHNSQVLKKSINKKIIKKINQEIDKREVDHNESIKDLIFNDNIIDFINEEENTENILKSINLEIEKESSNLKENLEIFDFDMKENSERNLIENNSNFKLEKYFDFENFPIYENPQNQIYLKACSLFNSSILLENDFFKINYDFENNREDSSNPNIKIIYNPIMKGSEIKVEILTQEKNINYRNLEKQLFNDEIVQNINLISKNFSRFTFPVLNVFYYLNSEIFEFKIPVPISINKFSFTIEIDSEFIQEYLFNVS